MSKKCDGFFSFNYFNCALQDPAAELQSLQGQAEEPTRAGMSHLFYTVGRIRGPL